MVLADTLHAKPYRGANKSDCPAGLTIRGEASPPNESRASEAKVRYIPSDKLTSQGIRRLITWRSETMSDWDFLYEMNERGYSAQEIADAAGSGAAPWEWEYIDREWVDSQLEIASEDKSLPVEPSKPFQSRDGFPFSTLEQIEIFHDLIDCATRHFENTGRYLQVWGELGEIYAEIQFGLRRHGTHRAGSDGTIAGKLVEVKTISPEKASDRVFVKSQGNFEQLLIVRIDRNFEFKGKLLERSELKGVTAKFLRGRLEDDTGA